METLYEAAGGYDGLLRRAGAWHERVMADGVPNGLRIPQWSWAGLVPAVPR